uniref:TNF receptor-associated factor 3-like isoform X1 n=1 Tax=Myxine glutinosa TaxID=7769 RepID=UPI00358F01F6
MDLRSENHGSSTSIASLTSCPQPTTSDSWPPLRGYAFNFVETPPAKYCCGVCSLPLREAHQTGCGHRLCRSCADGLLTETNPQCPECSETLDQKQSGSCITKCALYHTVYRDTCCNREILNLPVFCPNEASGCCETMVLHKLLVHLDTCPYELVACHNAACSVHLARLYMPQHHVTCPFRLEFCKFCSAPVPCVQLEEHKQTCPKYLLLVQITAMSTEYHGMR